MPLAQGTLKSARKSTRAPRDSFASATDLISPFAIVSIQLLDHFRKPIGVKTKPPHKQSVRFSFSTNCPRVLRTYRTAVENSRRRRRARAKSIVDNLAYKNGDLVYVVWFHRFHVGTVGFPNRLISEHE